MKLSKNEIFINIIVALWTLGNTMSAVFVNIYLYTYTGSLVVMTAYCMIRIGMFPLCFTIAGKWAQRKNFVQTTIIGIVVTIFSLLYVLKVNASFEQTPNLVYIVALLVGVGEGFFWLSINSLISISTKEETRALFYGINGVLNNLANIIAPICATVLIDHSSSDTQGYIRIFQIVIVIYVVMVFFASRVQVSNTRQSFSIRKCLKISENSEWKYAMVSTFLYGMRDSLILTLAGLLVYNATDAQGSFYSRLLVLFAIVSIIFYIISAKVIKRRNLYFCYCVGAVFISSSTIVLVLFSNIAGAIYYGLVNAMATPFYANAYQLINVKQIQKFKEKENLIGRVIAKEIYLTCGRCLGMLCIIVSSFVFSENLYLIVSVFFCSLFPIILVVYASKYELHR